MSPLGSHHAPSVPESIQTIGSTRARVFGNTGKPLIIAPGLHFLGADDVRVRRIGRVLASVGYHVHAPFIEDYMRLQVTLRSVEQYCQYVSDVSRGKPVDVLSFSFGSIMAIRAAAEMPQTVERVTTFGGLGDFIDVIQFSIYGTSRLDPAPPPFDPLNRPASYINAMPQVGEPGKDLQKLNPAWIEFCRTTWGREYYKHQSRHVAVAQHFATSLPKRLRPLFLEGCGVTAPRPGIIEVIHDVQAHWLQPVSYAPNVTSATTIIHSANDNVVPPGHAHALGGLFEQTTPRILLLGSFGHSGPARISPLRFWDELRTMNQALAAMTPA